MKLPAETVIARHRRRKKRVKRITIDLDPLIERNRNSRLVLHQRPIEQFVCVLLIQL